MLTILSLVTSVKDYIEVVHKLVETNTPSPFDVMNYSDFGAIFTYLVITGKEFFSSIFTFKWLQNIGSLPLIVPDIASALISEISVLDGYFHNAFTFLEKPLSYGDQNTLFYGIEKFGIGLVNSLFLFLPTSTAHIITIRRFIMQGLEAGYLAGLGTLAGNILWIGSIVFGLRFIVIPWLSLDILRYGLGFLLLVKYMWDSYSERRTVLEDLSKTKIFLLNFLLAFTEQATVYPFLSNLSIGSDATILESFPTSSFLEYTIIHVCYLGGLLIGSLSLLQLTCWFWENPAFNIYMWTISSLKITNTFSQKFVNLCFLYFTMFFAISNVSYFGLDYTITNPLGFVHEDRLIDQKVLLETSFLNSKASDRNTRRNRGRHGRRERWKRRVRRYRTFDASLYDQGVYDLFTIEDLNYGFDRFWLRRKIRNHRVRFRFFPGPWMRSFKKQLARPRLESFMGPRVEFFRILFEQAYHPEFHEFRNFKDSKITDKTVNLKKTVENQKSSMLVKSINTNNLVEFYSDKQEKIKKQNLLKDYSALRKFIRKVKTRTNTAQIFLDMDQVNSAQMKSSDLLSKTARKPIYLKQWKQIFSKTSHNRDQGIISKGPQQTLLNNFYKNTLLKSVQPKFSVTNYFSNFLVDSSQPPERENGLNRLTTTKQNSEKLLSNKDRQILRYKTFLKESNLENQNKVLSLNNIQNRVYEPLTLLHPIKFYLQKEQAFKKKMKFYGANLLRNFGIENNAPYYRVMMKKFFYYYKPTLRWERTMRTATMRKARRKGPRIPRKLNVNKKTQMLTRNSILLDPSVNKDRENAVIIKPLVNESINELQSGIVNSNMVNNSQTLIQKPTHFYSLVSKRATRYRYQIYKDVLQHWYYSPFNRFLLKFDVDSFIRRQPAAHFLTKNEENLLHLKRFLLSDYYNTLRWYSYMQHYDSMKSSIGKTKSFANRSYNQQFFGTFKKIRHLFAITPSLTNTTVLKFDQPLFNEYPNLEKNAKNNFSFYNSSVIHEELLADEDIYSNYSNFTLHKNLPEDFTNQSTKILKTYLQEANPIRENYIKQLLKENNYSELTNFLMKGQKMRGDIPITNETDLINQEKNYLLNLDKQVSETEKLHNFFKQKIDDLSLSNLNKLEVVPGLKNPEVLWISLMKKSRNMLYNQEALRFYVSRRVDKLEKQKKRQQKFFQDRLKNIRNWVNLVQNNTNQEITMNNELSGLTTSLQKAIKEGIYYQTTGEFSGRKLEKWDLRNNRPKILKNLPVVIDFQKQQKKMKNLNSEDLKIRKSKNISLKLKNHLKNRSKFHAIQTIQAEQELRKTFVSIQKLSKNKNSEEQFKTVHPSLLYKIINRTLIPFQFVSNSISKNAQLLVNSEKGQVVLNPIKVLFKVFQKNTDKNFQNWKQREIVFSTRKKIRRKISRVLDQKKQLEKRSTIQELERLRIFKDSSQLREKPDNLNLLENKKTQKSWTLYENIAVASPLYKDLTASKQNPKSQSKISAKRFSNLFEKNLKKKRTRSRRYRRFKGRGPIKKHTLAEKLKRQFKLLKRYGEKQEVQDKKMEIFQMITKRKYDPNSSFETRETKQRRTRQSKHRYWKKHKRQKYLQTKRKQRKRRRYAISKLRVLNKELKRIKTNLEIKNWWWQQFLPNFMATTDAYWKMEKDKQIKQELSSLSLSEILDRDRLNTSNVTDRLQIGNQDFKPLALPEALRLRNQLTNQGEFNSRIETELAQNRNSSTSEMANSMKLNNLPLSSSPSSELVLNSGNTQVQLNTNNQFLLNNFSKNNNIVSKLSENLLTKQNSELNSSVNSNVDSKKMLSVNPIPFYAGWDETARQFIVTNRLLSRKEAGYSINFIRNNSSIENVAPNLQTLEKSSKDGKLEFTKAPLQGMNAATTLYWQIPFTTYDPDQFFALGMDGFSPLAWRFFHFKYSQQTTKPMLVKNIIYANQQSLKNQSLLSYNIHLKMLQMNSKNNFTRNSNLNTSPANQMSKTQSRKIQKRQKRVKKHPRPPVWFPSGPLANQVLPVHYIYVFYKRTRLPRDRYIGRRLRRSEDPKATFIQSNFTKLIDFTLRKRVKPIRKYHRKRILNKNKENGLIIRRRPFKAFEDEKIRFRPIIQSRLTTQTDILNAEGFTPRLFKSKQRKKTLTNKQTVENLRIRQLRRRIQRQVLRPIWRYKPRAGGFVWPGDYLRLESVKAPLLKINNEATNTKISSTKSNLQIRKKKRRNIQEWQIQPKKYLLQKHNLKVLKKTLEKSQNLEKLPLRSKLL